MQDALDRLAVELPNGERVLASTGPMPFLDLAATTVIELKAQLDRAPQNAAKLIDQGKRIRSLEQQQEGIRVWAKRAGWKGVVQLYSWVIDYVDRVTKQREALRTRIAELEQVVWDLEQARK